MEKSIMYRLNLSMIFNKAWPRLACYHNESCCKKKGNYAKVPKIILTTPFLASGPLTIQLIHAIFTQKLRKETINKIWHTKIALHQVLFFSCHFYLDSVTTFGLTEYDCSRGCVKISY